MSLKNIIKIMNPNFIFLYYIFKYYVFNFFYLISIYNIIYVRLIAS